MMNNVKYVIFLQLFCFHGASAASDLYVECIPGDLNLILSAPHDGKVKPDTIPDRDAGCWDETAKACVWTHDCGQKDETRCKAVVEFDYNTEPLTKKIREQMFTLTGKYPCVVINKLHRIKYDANRNKAEGAFGIEEVEEAYDLYHKCADDCQAKFSGRGLFIDIHGQSHPHGWLELAYLPTAEQLNTENYTASDTSVGELSKVKNIPIKELIFGDRSFGKLMEDLGVPSVPSPARKGPQQHPYFNGNFNPVRHGSKGGGTLDAIQAESTSSRRQNGAIDDYSRIFATAIGQYMEANYGTKIIGKVWPKNAAASTAFSPSVLLSVLVLLMTYFHL